MKKNLNDRQQKINLLKRIQEGKANIKQIIQQPYGMVIFENDGYHFPSGKIMNPNEFDEFLKPYRGDDSMTVYGMIIR